MLPSAKLSPFLSITMCCAVELIPDRTGGEGGGGGAKSYDGERAWSSINHSKLKITPSGPPAAYVPLQTSQLITPTVHWVLLERALYIIFATKD
jgi:hypothetical protein